VHCGSPSYAAPEIVSRQLYDGPPVDVWSLGVVLFAMITGYLPFHSSGSNKDELCQRIIAGVYKIPDWISDESRDLLRGMLTTDPRRRLTVEQVRVVSFGLVTNPDETQTPGGLCGVQRAFRRGFLPALQSWSQNAIPSQSKAVDKGQSSERF
jgi:serine/threonine protein kinase